MKNIIRIVLSGVAVCLLIGCGKVTLRDGPATFYIASADKEVIIIGKEKVTWNLMDAYLPFTKLTINGFKLPGNTGVYFTEYRKFVSYDELGKKEREMYHMVVAGLRDKNDEKILLGIIALEMNLAPDGNKSRANEPRRESTENTSSRPSAASNPAFQLTQVLSLKMIQFNETVLPPSVNEELSAVAGSCNTDLEGLTFLKTVCKDEDSRLEIDIEYRRSDYRSYAMYYISKLRVTVPCNLDSSECSMLEQQVPSTQHLAPYYNQTFTMVPRENAPNISARIFEWANPSK